MSMTETEMANLLGLLIEPVQNRVLMERLSLVELIELQQSFKRTEDQRQTMGAVNPDLWTEFVPWHSLN